MSFIGVEKGAQAAIRLGKNVTADGRIETIENRIQSHLHLDHMKDFKQSLRGKVYLSPPTEDLYYAKKNQMFVRKHAAIQVVEPGEFKKMDSFSLLLQYTNHMLGAVQIIVEENGIRAGYSGDFTWPPPKGYKNEEVDILVLDATCNDTRKRFEFTQTDVDQHFGELLINCFKKDRIILQAVDGTIQRALQVLAYTNIGPIVMSDSEIRQLKVYQKWGYTFPTDVICENSPEFIERCESGNEKYVKTKFSNRKLDDPVFNGINIVCNAFSPYKDHPVRQDNERSFTVAMTNHADVDGTIDYVVSTGAKTVLVDSTRGGNAPELAKLINDRLGLTGVRARPSP